MKFEIQHDDQTFRREVRAFIAANLRPEIAARGVMDYDPREADVREWMGVLDRRGWSVPNWPEAYGGVSWSPLQKHIFAQELRRARAPVLDRVGTELVGPVLIAFGSDWQKRELLPRIRSGADWWGQGFSEPGAGSDLASLRTRAERIADDFVINGQKIWTTCAQYAQWFIVLVRTDQQARPQSGISVLLVEADRPGITRRPIESIDGGFTLNEIFFDDVRVPARNLVGEINKGWSYTKYLLMHERTISAEVPHTQRDIDQLKRIAATTRKHGRPLIEDPHFRLSIAKLEADVMALEWAVLRVLYTDSDDKKRNSVASVLKLRGNELRQQVADLCVDALGEMGVALFVDPSEPLARADDRVWPELSEAEAKGVSVRAIFRRAVSIYGGSNEIQREIISKSILGL